MVSKTSFQALACIQLRLVLTMMEIIIRGHPLSTYAKFSEKLTMLTPWYAYVRVRIRGLEMLVFRKILRTYLMDHYLPDFFKRKHFSICSISAGSNLPQPGTLSCFEIFSLGHPVIIFTQISKKSIVSLHPVLAFRLTHDSLHNCLLKYLNLRESLLEMDTFWYIQLGWYKWHMLDFVRAIQVCILCNEGITNASNCLLIFSSL